MAKASADGSPGGVLGAAAGGGAPFHTAAAFTGGAAAVHSAVFTALAAFAAFQTAAFLTTVVIQRMIASWR